MWVFICHKIEINLTLLEGCIFCCHNRWNRVPDFYFFIYRTCTARNWVGLKWVSSRFFFFVFACKITEPTFEGVNCDNERMTLQCQDRVIMVTDAMYGRQDDETCPVDDTSRLGRCTSPDTFTKLSQLCNYKHKCDITVITDLLGDPCPEINKYLTVTITCMGMWIFVKYVFLFVFFCFQLSFLAWVILFMICMVMHLWFIYMCVLMYILCNVMQIWTEKAVEIVSWKM